MKRQFWKLIPVLVGMTVLVVYITGCNNNNGTEYSTQGTPAATATPSAEKTAAPESSAAAVQAAKAAEATASKIQSLPDKEKEAMAEAGHSFPAPPKDRPHLAADVPTAEHDVTGVLLTVPKSWKETPKDQLKMMRAAQFEIPAAEGSKTGAELVAYNFGPGQGGTVMANIERWIQQVKPDPDTRPDIYQQKVNGLKVTEVYIQGTLLPTTMGSGPKEAQPDSALYGVIIEGAPSGSIFLKTTGDRKSIDAAKPALATLIDSIKPAKAEK